MGTRKSMDREGNVVGQEAAKLEQLRKMGYTPVVLPFANLNSPTVIIYFLNL